MVERFNRCIEDSLLSIILILVKKALYLSALICLAVQLENYPQINIMIAIDAEVI